jgi:hypothetical protein
MEVLKPTVFKIGIEDRPGALSELLADISDSGANVMFMSALSVGSGRGEAFIIADEPDKVAEVAKSRGMTIDEYTGLLVKGADKVGVGAEVTRPLANEGINILLSSAMVSAGEYRLVIVVDPAYLEAAEKVLGAA